MDYSFEVCSMFGRVLLSEDRKVCALLLYPEHKRVALKSIWLDLKLIFNCIGLSNVFKAMDRESKIKKIQPKEKMCYLWFIGVNPIYQGFGIGSKLLREIIEESESGMVMNEESIRVPLLIYDPNLPDKVTQYKAPQMALNIDIAPTILSMAGVQVPKSMQGVNLIDLVEDKIPERNDFFYQHYFLGGPRIPREEGVVTTDFKYMNYVEHNYEELFDVKHDPHETMNLANDPKYKMKLKELRKRYKELREVHGVPQKDWEHIKSSF
jgi:GNAT superfamily N-acetyltransferase